MRNASLSAHPPLGNSVEVLPIGIGQAGRETPRNWVTAVERKQERAPHGCQPPIPAASMRRGQNAAGDGAPGPDNPMGLYADLHRRALPPSTVPMPTLVSGCASTRGCIRLRNDDIKFLFDNVPVGTRVQLIDQPVKYSVEPDGSRWPGGARAAVAQPRGV
ncbi:L,D-transpeptidase family protein [Klebsiella pneumoniae]|nr:L,D-transpeptidase family protein [Klebsiella pneumoniae]